MSLHNRLHPRAHPSEGQQISRGAAWARSSAPFPVPLPRCTQPGRAGSVSGYRGSREVLQALHFPLGDSNRRAAKEKGAKEASSAHSSAARGRAGPGGASSDRELPPSSQRCRFLVPPLGAHLPRVSLISVCFRPVPAPQGGAGKPQPLLRPSWGGAEGPGTPWCWPRSPSINNRRGTKRSVWGKIFHMFGFGSI